MLTILVHRRVKAREAEKEEEISELELEERNSGWTYEAGEISLGIWACYRTYIHILLMRSIKLQLNLPIIRRRGRSD